MIAGILIFIFEIILFVASDYLLAFLSFIFGKYVSDYGSVVLIIFMGGLFLVGVASFIGSNLLQVREKGHRREDLQKLAQQMKWQFLPAQHLPFLIELTKHLDFDIEPPWIKGASINLLQGQISGRNFFVCDQLYYSELQGSSSVELFQTIVGIEIKEANLPVFCLTPKNGLESLFEVVDFSNINPLIPASLADKFSLYKGNTLAVNQFFTQSIIDFYKQYPPFTTICGGKYLVITQDDLLRPDEILQQISFIEKMATFFLKKN